jgi:hypothetical protein
MTGRLLMLLLLSAVSLSARDVSGGWKIQGAFDDVARSRDMNERADLVCTFKQTDDRLTGNCGPDADSGVTVAGDVQGQTVVWRFEVALDPDSPKQITTFTGTLDDAGLTMKGTFTIAALRGTFTATKQ